MPIAILHPLKRFFFSSSSRREKQIIFSQAATEASSPTTRMKEAIETLGPLIDRIISNPLSFTTARNQTLNVDEKPDSYIVLSKSKSTKQTSSRPEVSQHASEDPKGKDGELPMKRPRSMYEAVQAYTGKRFMTKAEKRAEKRAEMREKEAVQAATKRSPAFSDSEDLGEDLGEDIALDGLSVSEYESASEFPSAEDAVSSGESEESDKKVSDDESEEQEEQEGEAGEVARSDSESGSYVADGTALDDDEEDDDYDINRPEDTESDSEDAEEASLDEESHSENDSPTLETSSPESESVPKPAADEVKGEDEGTNTPPTSPEEELTKATSVEESFKKDVAPLTDFYQINEYEEDRGSNHSTRIYKNWRELKGQKPLGLLNHGVTCYMNSAIQAMIHIPAMQHYLNDIHDGQYSNVLKPRSVSMVLSELSRKMWGLDGEKKTPSYVNPKRIIQRLEDINCMMSEWQQEDAHEYFMSLMSRLQEDLTPKGKKLNLSIIYDIFGGLLHQAVTCKNCGHVSNTKQEFYDLSLGLNKKKKSQGDAAKNHQKYSIEKSIHDFFSSELIKHDKNDTSSGYECEECKQRTNAMKISTIDRAPEALTVHLKRFKFNGNSSSKMKQLVAYPQYLDLTQYSSDKSPVKYELTSVIVHEGRLLLSGHYVAHCLQSDGSWANYDDEYINKVGDREALTDPSAYFLIYSRLTHKGLKRKSEVTTANNTPLSKKTRY